MPRNLFCSGLFACVLLVGLSISFAKAKIGEAAETHPFRLTIQMFHGTEPTPIAQHLILFDHDMIYALPSSDEEPITVIDEANQCVTLLDRGSRSRTSIPAADLLHLTSQLRASASTDELRQRLGINAQVHVDEPSGVYSVAYGEIAYSTTTQTPAQSHAAEQFSRFSDWASRLNIARKLGMPPFGRMLMNSQIAADGRIPLETSLQVRQGTTTTDYRSRHEVTFALTTADRDRINEIAGMMALYKEVPLTEFSDH